ncbi:unnamed protein product [Rotaria sp. Silwood1]|nr:unnamed protein product [Rotaria sp. Silwood1]
MINSNKIFAQLNIEFLNENDTNILSDFKDSLLLKQFILSTVSDGSGPTTETTSYTTESVTSISIETIPSSAIESSTTTDSTIHSSSSLVSTNVSTIIDSTILLSSATTDLSSIFTISKQIVLLFSSDIFN